MATGFCQSADSDYSDGSCSSSTDYAAEFGDLFDENSLDFISGSVNSDVDFTTSRPSECGLQTTSGSISLDEC